MPVLTDSPIHAVVPATNLDRAREFYRDVLGLSIQWDSQVGVMLEAGDDSAILVYPRPGGKPPESTAAGFLVDDIESAIDELTDNDVVFEQYNMERLKTNERGIAEGPDGSRSAWFKDSEGNILAVSQLP